MSEFGRSCKEANRTTLPNVDDKEVWFLQKYKLTNLAPLASSNLLSETQKDLEYVFSRVFNDKMSSCITKKNNFCVKRRQVLD
jgi:hypothetical protein